jgi:hypothetical protein
MKIVDPERVEAVVANLVAEVQKHEYTTAGDIGNRFVILALSEYGRNDLVYKVHHRTTIPGYGWQIQQGLSSLAECWDGRSVASLNHCMLGHIQEWFHSALLGIQYDPEAVAFKQIIIRPQIVGDIKWVKGKYDSVRGRIEVDWRLDGDKVILALGIPANTSATVHVPTTQPTTVLEGGKPADQSQGVTFICACRNAATYRIESGRYTFTANWK